MVEHISYYTSGRSEDVTIGSYVLDTLRHKEQVLPTEKENVL